MASPPFSINLKKEVELRLTPSKTMDEETKQHASKCPAKDMPVICKCDGYHTWDELYEHRVVLWIALCKSLSPNIYPNPDVWRSKLHSDGSSFEGWFILGVTNRKKEQMTYHLPNSKWEATNFAKTLDKAPEFDGHTSDDVLERLKNL